MAPLHAPVAIAALTHSNIEKHDSPPDDFFLILFPSFPAPRRRHNAAAVRQGDRDPFIHAHWCRTARLPAVAAARFSAWALRIGFGLPRE